MSPTFTVERSEMLKFAKRWDQLPIHVDDVAADAAFGGGGIIAPGAFVMAILSRLRDLLPEPQLALIAVGGLDEIRIPAPVRAGDSLRLTVEFLEHRESRSKPDRGVSTNRVSVINQNDVIVWSHIETAIVRRRSVRIDSDGTGATPS